MDCDCLIHPFQNDPGTSQSQRVMDSLLSGAAKIDARTLADLLDYFVQMSRHINFYDLQLNVNDWQPFFKNSVPFSLASIIKFPQQDTDTSLALYKKIFQRRPSGAGLQLLSFSVYYRFINNINNWHLTLKDSSLPLVVTIEALIRNKLQGPVQQFIKYVNAGVQTYGINRIDFLKLSTNPVWGLDSTMINAVDTSFSAGTTSAHQRLINLYDDMSALLTVFTDAVKALATAAMNNLEPSFIPLKEELQKKHPPHLALLFAFLNMFRQLQNDLNQYTKKHLDYFYKDILQFQSQGAIPDKANIVFEIQKALKSYLLKKGLLVKDGKDKNSQEILFALDDDIVVTQTTIADKKTLFLNNQLALAQTYVEGVYMAPNALMANGVDKPFTDDPKNFPTLGAHESKYIDPEGKYIVPYPNARLGFILASQVLLLQTGSTRTITIDLPCTLIDSICGDLGDSIVADNKNCCNDQLPNPPAPEPNPYPWFLRSSIIYPQVLANINKKYVYLSEDIFKLALKKGFTKDFIASIRENFLHIPAAVKPCYCDLPLFETEDTAEWTAWDNFLTTLPNAFDADQRAILDTLFPPQKILNLGFSGQKNWIIPAADDYTISMDPGLGIGNTFKLQITATLAPATDSVAAYDKSVLIEDFGTMKPVVKVQLNDHIKLKWKIPKDPEVDQDDSGDCCKMLDDCCLLIGPGPGLQVISYYHFFRNVTISQENLAIPLIEVDVCGLKNIIVQSDDSLMDVNAPILPFSARPKIDSNFYIGSEEIFLKKWQEVYVNLNWTNKPADFKKYYLAYQTHLLGHPPSNVVTEDDFKIQISILQDGDWEIWKHCQGMPDFDCKPMPADIKCEFFQDFAATGINCTDNQNYLYQYAIIRATDFVPALPYAIEKNVYTGIKKMTVATRFGFIRITLKCQDFQHSIYPFILARQMLAFGKLPQTVDGAVYFDQNGDPIVFSSDDIKATVASADQLAANVDIDVNGANGIVANTPAVGNITGGNADRIRTILAPLPFGDHLAADAANLFGTIDGLNTFINNIASFQAVIPNEPWTPTISNISVDYKAIANFEDVDLIHLYPYNGTYKSEELSLQPTLFPEFCDEGTLFLGLQNLVPGDNLNVLFQLAEATSDSESDPEEVFWYYLDNNTWKPLRTGFEVMDDATKNLTSTGIIKFALPANMTKDNTVMPAGMHWIKATIPQNSGSVSETTDILTQAIKVVFTNDDANDKLRLAQPLTAGSISKLNEADASVKSVTQPYDAFGGLVPEIQQQFYVRVSETLRHKGRAIQAFDYERIVLQQFPQLFKVKCINHSFALNAHAYKNDFPYAPGYVLMAVIPDLNQLKAGNSFEPKVPVSIIEDIDTYIRARTSPFVRFRAMNPRYEKINFCLRIKLLKGKDENYYKEKIKEDISEFLAPWAVGDYYKLTFGQCVYRSDIIQFLETRDYMDYISDLQMGREGSTPDPVHPKVCPATPRSILIAGNIEVCIDPPDCDRWGSYVACDENNPIVDCNTKPEKISDYCKPLLIRKNG